MRKAFIDWDPIRVENRCLDGTPDVNLANGVWIELKWIRKKPKNEDRVLLIDHYTTEQRIFAIKRELAGGKVFVLLKISNEWFLFNGTVASQVLGKISLIELRKAAVKIWQKKLNNQELRQLLMISNSPSQKNY